MKVCVYEGVQDVARAAAMVFVSEMMKRDGAVIGLATGSSPVPCYGELIRLCAAGLADFTNVVSFNLDEYTGLAPDHPCSYRRYMNEQFFDHINIDKKNTFVPDGLNPDPEGYDRAIAAAGGIDLQLLGIGTNGHIGFNEPGDSFVYPTNIVPLTQSTIRDNARFFDSIDQVPKSAISMGIGTILSARRILLIATGKNKARAVRGAIQGPIVPQLPASILRVHPNCQILLDREAAGEL